MSAQTIDYDALAQKHGAVSAPVDYDALATKHGASMEAAAPAATAPATYNDYKDKYGSTGTGLVILPKGVQRPPDTPENQQQFQTEQANQAATAGQMMLGGGGIKSVAQGAEALAPAAKPILKGSWKILDAASFDRVGKIYNALKTMGEEVGEAINPAKFPGANLPATPPAELLQARTLAQGGQAAAEPAAAVLGKIAAPVAPAVAQVADTAAPIAQGVKNIPPTLRGDSALRQVLTGQDNANLTKIARSRGINIAQESQLKPGFADNRLINKIIDDFSPEELHEVEAQFMENTRFRHAFGDIGPEAWKTMSLKTYFPEVKVSAAQVARTQKAIANIKAAASQAQSASEDLTPEWQAALKQIQAAKGAQ